MKTSGKNAHVGVKKQKTWKHKNKKYSQTTFMTKRETALIFSVVILCILLVTSVILGVTGYFSSASYLSSNSELVVGDNVTIGVKPNETSVISMTFDGSYLPDENIPQVIQISSQDLNSDLKVRVKAQVFGTNSNFEFITTSHFQQEEDGYYYFDEDLKGGNKITFCNYVKTPKDNNFVSNEKYILTIVVETIESQFGQTIWKTA